MIAKLLISAVLLAMGIFMAWAYIHRSPPGSMQEHPLSGHRPWRKVGAGICLLMAVMFVLGIYVVDIPERPIPYALYWIIMLGLVIWLFVLAVRDFMYTRSLVRRWREDLSRTAAHSATKKRNVSRESMES